MFVCGRSTKMTVSIIKSIYKKYTQTALIVLYIYNVHVVYHQMPKNNLTFILMGKLFSDKCCISIVTIVHFGQIHD